MSRPVTRLVLGAAGAVLGLIGAALLIAPVSFMAASQIVVEPDPSLMSELSAPGGVLLITSALMILGAVRLRFADPALVLGAVVYGAYGITRLLGLALHGLPSASIIAAMAIELAIAAWLIALRRVPSPDALGLSRVGREAERDAVPDRA